MHLVQFTPRKPEKWADSDEIKFYAEKTYVVVSRDHAKSLVRFATSNTSRSLSIHCCAQWESELIFARYQTNM